MERFETTDGDVITMARYNSKTRNFTLVTQEGYKYNVDQWNGRIVAGMMTAYIGDIKEFSDLLNTPNMWTHILRGE
jgi:hypothetical protein